MQYAVYLHAWRTQGASVASVCVTRREGKKRGEQRKQARVTPDSPSASSGNYSRGWGVGCRGCWRPSCLSTHSNKGCVICNMSMCVVILFSTRPMLVAAHVGITFGINISGQNPCKLLWRFVIRAVSLLDILLYTTGKHQMILEHDGGSRNPIKYTRYDHWKVCSPYFSGAFCSIR